MASETSWQLTSTSLRRLAWAVPILVALGMAVFLLQLVRAQAQMRQDTLTQARQRIEQLAHAKAGQIDTLLSGADLLLRQFRDQYATRGPDAAQATVSAAFQTFPPGSIVHFAVANAEGVIEFSTLGPLASRPDQVRENDRDHFAFHARHPVDELHINPPVRTHVTNSWAVLLTRPIITNGRFNGVAALSLSPAYLSAALAPLPSAADDVSSLVFNDGTYLARSRDLQKSLGTRLPPDRPMFAPEAGDHGSFQTLDMAEDTPRVYGWTKLPAWGLIVTLGQAESSIMASTETEIRRAWTQAAVVLPLVALLAAAISRLLFVSAAQQQRVLSQRSLLRVTLDSTADGILVITPDGRVLEMNQRFKVMWRVPFAVAEAPDSDSLAAHAASLLQDPDSFRQSVERTFSDNRQRESELLLKTGEIYGRTSRPVQLQGESARLLSFRDITAQRMAEMELRKLSMAVEQSPESILITNLDARIEYVNEAFVRNTGYSRAELLGQNPKLLQSGATSAQAYADMWATLVDGQPWSGEFRNRRKNGSEYIESALVAPIRDSNGQVTHYLGVKEDVTEKRQLAQELAQHRTRLEELVAQRTAQLAEARDRAQAASVAKSAFLANMSHEIRTPINAITGMAFLMRRDGLNPQQTRRLDRIDHAGQHLFEVINAILDLSKIEADRFSLEQSELSIPALLTDTAEMVQERAHAKGLALLVEPPATTLRLLGDATRLQQALLNYITNAIKFTDTGRITLRASLQQEGPDDVTARFEVEDTGIGIDAATLSRLFMAFEQADNSTTRKFGGTGLGLAIARKLAELMGGQAGATSTPGKGSRFWFTARLRKWTPEYQPPEAAASELPELTLLRDHAGSRILVVDDDPVNRDITVELLQHAGLEGHLAQDGLEAVKLVAQQHYDLILMDMQMPRMDGLDATRGIRQAERGPRTPIVAMTANAFAEDRRRCTEAGMNDFITKPVNPEAFFSVLLKWLSRPPETASAPRVGNTTDTSNND